MISATASVLSDGPTLATASLRPVTARLIPQVRKWPEHCALLVLALIMAASIWASGAVDGPIYLACSAVIFATSGLVCCFSSNTITRDPAVPAFIMILPASAVAYAALQTADGMWFGGHLASAAPTESLLATLRMASYFALFVAIRWCASTPQIARHAVMVMFGFIALVGTISLLTHDPKFAPLTHPGLTGPFANRSAFAMLMGVGLCIGAAFATQGPHPRADRPVFLLFRASCIMGCALLFVAILQSQSRLGLVSACVSVSVICALRARAHTMLWAGGAVALLLSALATIELDVFYRFQTLPRDIELRSTLYAQIWAMIMSRPMTGHGAGAFQAAFEHHHTSALTAAFVWDRAHSTFLTLWAEMGLIVGSLVPVAALGCGVQALRRFWRYGQAHALAGVAVLVLALIHAFADFSLEFPANAYFIIALAALGLGPLSTQRKDT